MATHKPYTFAITHIFKSSGLVFVNLRFAPANARPKIANEPPKPTPERQK